MPVTVVRTTEFTDDYILYNNFFRRQRFAKPITDLESLNFSAFSAYFGHAMRAVLRMQLIVERICCEYQCDTVAPGAEVHYRGQTGATSRKDCTRTWDEYGVGIKIRHSASSAVAFCLLVHLPNRVSMSLKIQ